MVQVSWTTPRTWVSSETVTSVIMNQHVRDNLRDLFNPSCFAYRGTTFTPGTGAATAIPLDAENWDTDTMHDNVTNNTRVTVKTAGKYEFIGLYSGSAGGQGLAAAIFVNGTQAVAETPNGNNVDYMYQTIWARDCAVNDYVEIKARNYGGSNAMTVNSGTGIIAKRFSGN